MATNGPATVGHLFDCFRDSYDEPPKSPTKKEAEEDAARNSRRRPFVSLAIGEIERIERSFTEQEHQPAKKYRRAPTPPKHDPER